MTEDLVPASNLPKLFNALVKERQVDFNAVGVLAAGDRVFALGSDTKVLSTIFEPFVHPLIVEIAAKLGYVVEEAPQTVYPDFTLSKKGRTEGRIAVDVKTTYRRPKICFTLGSYTSFLRNNTKNILYPYDQYEKHWIIGFAYSRRADSGAPRIVALADRANLQPPYENLEWFVQEKYKIVGERPGSGNTANLASIRSAEIQAFRDGRGPFAAHGEAIFRSYWANYENRAPRRNYASLREFLALKLTPR